jgi:rSAM/selenodomain-associated transferase 1
VHLIVIAKEPVAGQVKTRLCPPLSLAQAAYVAEAALSDTLDTVMAARVTERTLVLEGEAGTWLPSGLRVVRQRPGQFASRLAWAIIDAYALASLPVLLVGMDTPQMQRSHLESAATKLAKAENDAVLGLAEDGGFWAIGTSRPVLDMFENVEMSTARTGADQLRQLRALNLHCEMLPTMRDVDEIDDALRVAHDAPRTRFARAVRSCHSMLASGEALRRVGRA